MKISSATLLLVLCRKHGFTEIVCGCFQYTEFFVVGLLETNPGTELGSRIPSHSQTFTLFIIMTFEQHRRVGDGLWVKL